MAPPSRVSRPPLAPSSETTPLLTSLSPIPEDPPYVPPPPQPLLFTPRLLAILGATYLGIFLGAMDSTIIATLSTAISSEFNSMKLFSWLATAYLLANAACQPVSGRLTDIFGRGPGLVFSNLVFSLGNVICAVADSPAVMILGRVVAGVGGGGLMSIGTFLASDLIPLRQRGVVQGVGNLSYGAGAMLGGVLGGYIQDHIPMGWRFAFWIQVPWTILSAVLVWWLVDVPPKIPAEDGRAGYLKRIDFRGVFLTITFLVTLLLGLNSGGNLVPWTHWLPLTSIPLSLLFLAFLIHAELSASLPVVPVRLLLNRTVASACLANLCITMAMLALLFYIPLYLQIRGFSATETGTILLFSPVGVSIGSLGSGMVMKSTGKYWSLGVSVCALFVVGALATLWFDENTSVDLVKTSFFALGGGYGAMLTVTLLACISAVHHDEQAVITSALYLFRSLGSTIGIAVASAVFQNTLRSRLLTVFAGEPDANELVEKLISSVEVLKTLPDSLRDRAVLGYMSALKGVWGTLFGVALVGLIAVCGMRENYLSEAIEREQPENQESEE